MAGTHDNQSIDRVALGLPAPSATRPFIGVGTGRRANAFHADPSPLADAFGLGGVFPHLYGCVLPTPAGSEHLRDLLTGGSPACAIVSSRARVNRSRSSGATATPRRVRFDSSVPRFLNPPASPSPTGAGGVCIDVAAADRAADELVGRVNSSLLASMIRRGTIPVKDVGASMSFTPFHPPLRSHAQLTAGAIHAGPGVYRQTAA